jgi:hypothetical protein
MLTHMATAKTAEGTGRVRPWDSPRAVAQTASKTLLRSRIPQYLN